MSMISEFKSVFLRALQRGCGRAALASWAVCGWASYAAAAEIVRVGADYVVIDAGKASGLVLGDEVCFKNAAGETLACGEVQSLRKYMAGVRVAVEKLRQLTAGQQAVSPKLASPPRVSGPAEGPFLQAGTPRFQLDFIHTPLTPYRYNLASYNLAAAIAGSGPLWEPQKKVGSSSGGFEAKFSWPVSAAFAIAPGLRYRLAATSEVLADYDKDDAAAYASCKSLASSYGASFEAQTQHPLGALLLTASGGLDVDRSRVNFTATQYSASGSGTVAKLDSTLLVWSLRAGLRAEWLVGRFGFGLGAVALAPLAGKATSSNASQSLSPLVSAQQASNAKGDLQTALQHEQSTFGLEIALGASAAF